MTTSKILRTLSTWKKKKGKTSKLVDTGNSNYNERERERERERREIINMEWIDREEWRIKIKLQAQKDVKTLILCT